MENPTENDPDTSAAPARPSRLWLWFVAAFVVQGVAWTAWFVIASRNRVQEIPVVRGTLR